MAARVALSRSSLPPVRQTIKQVVRQRPHARFNSSQSTTPPPPPPKSGSWTIPVFVGVVALAGASGYYYYKRSGYTDGMSPAGSFPVAPGKKEAEIIAKPGDYQAVYDAIADALEDGADDYDDGSFGPVVARLAWHASGTYDKETGTGGSNGATMVTSHPPLLMSSSKSQF
jgi:cytochrome c peroxidase